MKTKARKKIVLGTLLIGTMGLVFMIGCAGNSPMSADSGVWIAPPPMTETHIASCIPEGYSFLRRSSSYNGMEIETGDSLHIEQLIYADVGGSVQLDLYKVMIHHHALHEDIVVSIDVPNSGILACDFGPHPYQFDNVVRLKLSYLEADIPPGVEEEDLCILYWNGFTQEYEFISGDVNTNANKIEGYTDHFSRYVIANRID